MQVNFDATGHEPQSFNPLPSAWYSVMMVEGLETPVKGKPDSTYFKSVWEVLDGEFKGRKLFHNFNFKNDNETAVKIAYDQLATICHAVGILKIQSMEQLFNKPLQAKVKLKAAVMEDDGVTEKYEAGNEIKGFRPLETDAPAGAGGLPEGFGDSGGLPEGFSAGAEATPEPEVKETPSTPATPKSPATAAAAPVKKLVMTDKANGGTAEQFRAHDAAWTDELLVQEGYARWEEVKPAVPSTPKTPSTPTTPSAPGTTSAPAGTAAAASETTPATAADDDDTPPWLQNA